MNVLMLSLLAVVSAGAAPANSQKPAATPARINACAVLTRAVVDKVTKGLDKITLNNPPKEDSVGQNGSSCDYGGVILQINPFSGTGRIQRNWEPVNGVGDKAYFNKVPDFFIELIVWTGPHHFALHFEVPPGMTSEQLKPNTIELANLIIPKLK